MRIFLLILFTFLATLVQAQDVRVYGSVTNSLNNEPIPFANVVIDGTTIGATTDFDGNFGYCARTIQFQVQLYRLQYVYKNRDSVNF